MKTALIGYTGFVGGNLLLQHSFADLYNSKNIESIAGRAYDVIVCAGAPAEKWKANQNPEADRATVERLMQALRQVAAEQFILISTVDVYPAPVDVDEASRPDWTLASAYGRHRHFLEEFAASQFPSLIVRLPGLFGAGLKKNIIYDFLHGNLLDKIHADARLQFYNLERLWADLAAAQAAHLSVVNLVTEPVSVYEIARQAFGKEFKNRPQEITPARYDVRSRHAALFGGGNGYLETRARVLEKIHDFVNKGKES